MKAALLVAVAAVLALATAQDAEGDKCASAGNCLSCVQSDGCGWCAAGAICTSGNEHGPSGSDLEGPTSPKNCSAWDYGFCGGAMCKQYTKLGCDSCVSDPFCGWCGESKKCVEGNEDGILWGTCNKGWMYAGQEKKHHAHVCPPKSAKAVAGNATDDDEQISPALIKSAKLRAALAKLKGPNMTEPEEVAPPKPIAAPAANESMAKESSVRVTKLQSKLKRLQKQGANETLTSQMQEDISLAQAEHRDVAERARANATKPSDAVAEEAPPADSESDQLQAKIAAKAKALDAKAAAADKAADASN